MYIQGMSSSLPKDVQEKMYRTIPGLKNCRFAKYAYAIEYDCIDPLALSPSLEVKGIKGLFSAGQFNGSSGYEEAAAQGLVAGINSARKIQNLPPLILGREEAYIGVLIDDLVTKGTNEPYRMMTARAEHRIMLRQDNADMRLTEKSYALGLATEERYKKLLSKKDELQKISELKNKKADRAKAFSLLEKLGEPIPADTPSIADLMKRPAVAGKDIAPFFEEDFTLEALDAAVIEQKYEGYLKKQERAAAEAKRLENKTLPESIDYNAIKGLRIEARQKLSAVKPLNIGQASRISGVSPADIAVLIVYLASNESHAR
jgi:tRNA uridine 5-carboxymethylaminomethyl modification enzyme